MVVRTYAPVGQTPVLKVPLTRDHISAIGGITPEGRIFMQMQERADRAEQVVVFLKLLMRKIKGKLLMIWDGSPHPSRHCHQRRSGGLWRPNVSIWNDYQALHPIGTHKKESGTCSNVANSKTGVAGVFLICTKSSYEPKRVFAIDGNCSRPVSLRRSARVVRRFRKLLKAQ